MARAYQCPSGLFRRREYAGAREKAEAALASGSIDAAVAALDLDPNDDVMATARLKKHLAGVLPAAWPSNY
jgi:hypothetical protein